jgi:hypothetical protein
MSIEISAPLPGQRGTKPWWYGEVLSALMLGAACVLAGAVVGVVWRYLAPMVQGVVSVTNGQKAAYYADPETKGFVGQDGTFAICGAVAAVLLAVVAFLWLRTRGPVGAAVGLAGGGIGAGYLAARLGSWLGPGHGSIITAAQNVPNNGTFDLPLQVSATGVIWLWPAVAVGLYFLLMLVFGPNDPDPAEEEYTFPQWADPVDLTAPGPQEESRPAKQEKR